MNIKQKVTSILLITITMVFIGCKSPLQKFIYELNYIPFEVIRSDWGAGTIITKNNGELIVAFNDECINQSARVTDASIPNYSYEVKRDNKLELNLAKILDENIKLESAFENNRVKKVNIKIEDAKEFAISEVSIKNKIKDFIRSMFKCN